MVSQHRRFELVDVSLTGLPIGRCTIDHWRDDRGETQWSARVLMARAHGTLAGQLVGRTREGEFLSGPATFYADHPGPRGSQTVLVELHGTGPLARTTEPEAQPETKTEPKPSGQPPQRSR